MIDFPESPESPPPTLYVPDSPDGSLHVAWGDTIRALQEDVSYLAGECQEWPNTFHDLCAKDRLALLMTQRLVRKPDGLRVLNVTANLVSGNMLNIFDFTIPEVGSGITIQSTRTRLDPSGVGWEIKQSTGPVVSIVRGQVWRRQGVDYRTAIPRVITPETLLQENPEVLGRKIRAAQHLSKWLSHASQSTLRQAPFMG